MRYWRNRKDLFDHVVMKGIEFIAGFITIKLSMQKETYTRCTVR